MTTLLVAISTRTANRILNKLKNYGMVRFSVICDPAAMKGFVVFGLLIYVNDDDGYSYLCVCKKSKESTSSDSKNWTYQSFYCTS